MLRLRRVRVFGADVRHVLQAAHLNRFGWRAEERCSGECNFTMQWLSSTTTRGAYGICNIGGARHVLALFCDGVHRMRHRDAVRFSTWCPVAWERAGDVQYALRHARQHTCSLLSTEMHVNIMFAFTHLPKRSVCSPSAHPSMQLRSCNFENTATLHATSIAPRCAGDRVVRLHSRATSICASGEAGFNNDLRSLHNI